MSQINKIPKFLQFPKTFNFLNLINDSIFLKEITKRKKVPFLSVSVCGGGGRVEDTHTPPQKKQEKCGIK